MVMHFHPSFTYIIDGPDSNHKFFEMFRLYADIHEGILVQLAIGNLYPELISLISIVQTLQNPTLGSVTIAGHGRNSQECYNSGHE